MILFSILNPSNEIKSDGYDVLIVGAGISGSVVADIFANKGYKVLVIDKRNHIAGNCYDYYDDFGILLHKYGPHIFHTYNDRVWNYISNRGPFRHYVHFINSYINGTIVPFPINRLTLNTIFKLDLKSEDDVDRFLEKETEEYKDIEVTNSEELILKTFGLRIFKLFYENYNLKMWRMPASKLAAAVSARIPWRKSLINRYFDDTYQALPEEGYTDLFRRLLYRKNVTVMTNTEMKKLDPKIKFRKVYYTGLIDELCNFSLGKLPYLSVDITFKTFEEKLHVLPSPVINYPNDHSYHRVFEAKWINPSFSNYSTLSYETSNPDGEPYYAIPNTTNHQMYKRYRNVFDKYNRMIVYGRLGDYKYYNMDKAIERALDLAEQSYSDIKSFSYITINTLLEDIDNVCHKSN